MRPARHRPIPDCRSRPGPYHKAPGCCPSPRTPPRLYMLLHSPGLASKRCWSCLILIASTILMLAACEPHQYLEEAESRFGVGSTWYGSDLRIYHAALLSPKGLGLRVPGYVVGVENLHPANVGFLSASDPQRLVGEHHVITHIVRYNLADGAAPRQPRASCVLYTLLDRSEPDGDPGRRLFDHCADHLETAPGSLGTASQTQGDAIARLRESLVDALERAPAAAAYSHIMVMIMGWNTDQERALRNFNSLIGNLADEAAALGIRDFRPLVIGVTWPSQWQLGEWSIVPGPIVRGVSFPFKRRDANDTGKYVLRDVIVHAVLAARQDVAARVGRTGGPRLVMIGHSFGARAIVKALASSEVAKEPFRPEDRAVLLEGAFEFKDLYEKGGRGPLA